MKTIDLDDYEIALIKIALSQWHCTLSLEAIRTGNNDLSLAASDVYELMQKYGAL